MIDALSELGIARERLSSNRNRVGIWADDVRKIGFIGTFPFVNTSVLK